MKLPLSKGRQLNQILNDFQILFQVGLGSHEDLGLDLSGGRDDLHCPGEKPIYISSIGKGTFLDGKLR